MRTFAVVVAVACIAAPPRPGRWRLVVPNGTKDGFSIPPPPLLRWVTVSR